MSPKLERLRIFLLDYLQSSCSFRELQQRLRSVAKEISRLNNMQVDSGDVFFALNYQPEKQFFKDFHSDILNAEVYIEHVIAHLEDKECRWCDSHDRLDSYRHALLKKGADILGVSLDQPASFFNHNVC